VDVGKNKRLKIAAAVRSGDSDWEKKNNRKRTRVNNATITAHTIMLGGVYVHAVSIET
jgi:hypothetical protein